MALQKFNETWTEWFTHADKRVASWPLMSSPVPTLVFILAYILSIYFGKIWMRSRKPYNIKGFLIGYNVILVGLSAYMTTEIFIQSYFVGGFTWVCNKIDHTEGGVGLASAIWVFYVSKFLETLDTIVMLLRKKEDQISFLHVYHHCSVIVLWWIGARFVPGGDAYWSSMQNSLVHTLMYTYYLFSALNVNVWWKKYITKLQMAQFFLNIVHTSVALLLPTCGSIPRWMGVGMIMYMSSLLVLFIHFYMNSYKDKRKVEENEKEE